MRAWIIVGLAAWLAAPAQAVAQARCAPPEGEVTLAGAVRACDAALREGLRRPARAEAPLRPIDRDEARGAARLALRITREATARREAGERAPSRWRPFLRRARQLIARSGDRIALEQITEALYGGARCPEATPREAVLREVERAQRSPLTGTPCPDVAGFDPPARVLRGAVALGPTRTTPHRFEPPLPDSLGPELAEAPVVAVVVPIASGRRARSMWGFALARIHGRWVVYYEQRLGTA